VATDAGRLGGAQRLLAASRSTVVIVNREATPLDGLATHVLRGAVEEILPALVAA
jgi:NAD-dependent SIR2 family protein deacetylase